MKKILAIVCMVCVVSVAVSAQGQKKSTYSFGGSSTVAPIANRAIEAFEKENDGIRVSYETLGSSTGIKQLVAGTLTLAGSSRELKTSEIEKKVIAIPIALDGLSVAVNKNVSIKNLTTKQLAAIFSGEITNWKAVGGPNAKIELIVRDETSGTFASFKEIIMDSEKKEVAAKAIVARENGELATKINATPYSIGYIGMAFNHIITENGGKILRINGVIPSEKTVKNGKYPISRKLYMVYKENLGKVEKLFIDFLLSSKGQEIVAQEEFIPIK